MNCLTFAAALAAIFSLGNAQAQAPIHTQTTVVVIDVLPAISTSTAYLTSLVTVLGCPPWETNCPVRNGHSIAVVTATTGITTTVCPLTLSQARLSSFGTTVASAGPAGPLSTSTTTWPTTYDLPSNFPTLASYNIPASVWASIFPSGAAGVTNAASGSGNAGGASGSAGAMPTSMSPTLSSVPAGFSYLGGGPSQSVSFTSNSFAAILPSNMTTYITTYNGVTFNITQPTGGSNGTNAGMPSLTAISNSSVSTGAPVPLQTVNVSPATPVNLFSLLVAIFAVALTV